jgi:hypothetical protein
MPVVPPVIKAKPYVIRFLPFHWDEKISRLKKSAGSNDR